MDSDIASLPSAEIASFQKRIFSWWKSNRRDLPWRHTHDPYRIYISEIMLQQTQVRRVIPKYLEFIERYPSLKSLSRATVADVLRCWKGMGYNRRAVAIHRTAHILMEQHSGIFPDTIEELMELPGIGQYTARAILVFAFRKDIAAIDINVRAIIINEFFGGKAQPERIIQQAADVLLPKGKSWQWHQALMDYGALQLPKLKSPKKTSLGLPQKNQRQTVPFINSTRYYRGRIIDLLRERPIDVQKLRTIFFDTYKKDTAFLDTILVRLASDGLIEWNKKTSIIRLPK